MFEYLKNNRTTVGIGAALVASLIFVGATAFLSGQITANLNTVATANDTIQSSEYGRIQREVQDLAAQNTMAVWTMVIAVSGLISLSITALGVIAVWRTLEETRKAVEATSAGTAAMRAAAEVSETIGKAQTRAYINVSDVRYNCTVGVISLRFQLHNVGQSPATNVCINISGELAVNRNDIVEEGSWPTTGRLTNTKVTARTDRVLVAANSEGSCVSLLGLTRPEVIDSFELDQRLHGISLNCSCTWFDVYGEEQVVHFRVYAPGPSRLPSTGTHNASTALAAGRPSL